MHVKSSTQRKIPEGLCANLSVHSLLVSSLPCELQSCHTPELSTPFLSSWPQPRHTWTPPPTWLFGNSILWFVFTFSGIVVLHCLISNIWKPLFLIFYLGFQGSLNPVPATTALQEIEIFLEYFKVVFLFPFNCWRNSGSGCLCVFSMVTQAGCGGTGSGNQILCLRSLCCPPTPTPIPCG